MLVFKLIFYDFNKIFTMRFWKKMASGFDDLLHQARQLTADMEVGSELPRVERTLIQIKDAANKMAYKSPSITGDGADVKALVF